MSAAAEVYMCISGEGEADDDEDGEDKYEYDYGGMEMEMDDEKAKVLIGHVLSFIRRLDSRLRVDWARCCSHLHLHSFQGGLCRQVGFCDSLGY